jgi:hypothetical protein
MSRAAICLSLITCCIASPAFAQEPESCRILCQPSLIFEPTITIENFASRARLSTDQGGVEREPRTAVFEAIFALDVPTRLPRVRLSFEAIVQPFVTTGQNPFTGGTSASVGSDIRDNPVEIESEINFVWLRSEQTGGWVSSHFDVVDQFSPAKRPTDGSVYTHKLDFELDTTVALFQQLPKTNWLRNVEVELSLDYLAGGRTRAGDQLGDVKYLDNASPWSFSFVFVIPIIHSE